MNHIMTYISPRQRRSTAPWMISLLLLLCLNSNLLRHTTTTGTFLVRAEEGAEVVDESDVSVEDEAIIDAMTGESVTPQSHYTSSTGNDHNRSMEERDPNLVLMTYDVGDGEKSTYVYVEPKIEDMYRRPSDQTATTELMQRVAPLFNGFAGKFINLSNKKCTLYWYVITTCIYHAMRSSS